MCGYDGDRCRVVQLRVLMMVAGLAWCQSVPAESGSDSGLTVQHDTVVVHAQLARQSDGRQEFHLSGDLRLHSTEWEIRADNSTLSGQLEDPELIVVRGSPARITVQRDGDARPFEGAGYYLEFDPQRETLRLNGDATVHRGGQSISSDAIRYWLERDTFAAGESARVKVVTTPKRRRAQSAQ
jgi:lipopolysaccharide transport protein LptA